jgi:Fe-S cluster assembly ATP-binding protein
MLTIQNISVSIEDKKIISDFSFTFEKGKTYVIMGPNGSGKSTLANTLMGHPSYAVSGAGKKTPVISLGKTDLLELDAHKRAREGMFMTFQSPLSLAGVSVYQLLQLAVGDKMDPLTLRRKIDATAKKLHIAPELLLRSLNEGASGGEKKKLEVLQASVLNKPVQIFDEIDTGVDVDALAHIATFLKANQKKNTYIIITHYNRILKYLKPDQVLVLQKGKLTKVGGYQLAKQIEKSGYAAIAK